MAASLWSRAITLAVQFAVLAWIARQLGPSSFGIVTIAMAIFTYMGFVVDLGTTTIAGREVARGGFPRVAGYITVARVLLTALSFVAAAAVLGFAQVPDRVLAMAVVLVVATLAGSINLRWLAQGREQFTRLAAVDLAGVAAQVVCAIAFVSDSAALSGAALALVMPQLTSTLLLLLQPDSSYAVLPRIDARALRRLLGMSLPIGISMLAMQLYNNADSVMLGVWRSTAEAGWYGAAYKIVNAGLAVPIATVGVLLPVLSRLHAGSGEGVPGIVERASRALMLFAVPFVVGGILTADTVVSLLYGPAFEPSAAPLRLLLLVVFTASANAPFGALMLARGMDRRYLAATVLGSAVNVGANFWVIPRFGMMGAATTTIVEEVIVLSLFVWFTRPLSLTVLRRSVGTTLVPVIAMALAVITLRGTVAAIPAGAMAFASVASLLWIADTRRYDHRLSGAGPSHGDNAPSGSPSASSDPKEP